MNSKNAGSGRVGLHPVRKIAAVSKTECVACGCCVTVCPKKAIDIYKGVFARIDENMCVGCSKCAKECPASVIRMEARAI